MTDSDTYLRKTFVGKLLVQFIQHFFGCENSSSVCHMTNMLDLTRSPFCVDPFLLDDIDLNQSHVSIGGNKGLLQRNASSCVLHAYLHSHAIFIQKRTHSRDAEPARRIPDYFRSRSSPSLRERRSATRPKPSASTYMKQ